MITKSLEDENMKMLGLPSPKHGLHWTFEMVRKRVETGFPAKSVLNLKKTLNLNGKEIADLFSVSPKTISRWTPRTSLRQTQSDRAYRIGRVLVTAFHILGNREKAIGWIREENVALGGLTPLDCFVTDVGTREVENILDRIKYGIYS